MPQRAHLAAILDGIGERRADTRIDLCMENSNRWIKPRSSSGRPSRLERPNGGASSELAIESDGMKARYAGEYLAPDAACPEESKRSIAFHSSVGDTQRSDSSALTNKWLRWLFLRDASVSACLEETPEWTV
jgi:hypothetical protein